MNIKIILYALLLWVAIGAPLRASDLRMQQANVSATQNDYEKAISQYEHILGTGVESPSLYFNLGYVHYKNGSLAKAILNFERARLLKPNDPDILYNLELAYSQTSDRIDKVGEVFFVRWLHSIRDKGNSDFWTRLFLFSFAILLGCAALYFFGKYLIVRKLGFYLGLGFVLLTLFSLSFASAQKNKLTQRNTAIIFSPSVTLTSAPDERGTELVVLHEGTKVKILSTLADWFEVELSDGHIGWIKKTAVEVI